MLVNRHQFVVLVVATACHCYIVLSLLNIIKILAFLIIYLSLQFSTRISRSWTRPSPSCQRSAQMTVPAPGCEIMKKPVPAAMTSAWAGTRAASSTAGARTPRTRSSIIAAGSKLAASAGASSTVSSGIFSASGTMTSWVSMRPRTRSTGGSDSFGWFGEHFYGVMMMMMPNVIACL